MKTLVISAFTTIRAANADATVVVKSDGKTATGLSGPAISEGDLTTLGERGTGTDLVRVLASELDIPKDGQTILIDDQPVMVTATRADRFGATVLIEYTVTRPTDFTQGI
jgi:hypothetical protein